MPGDLSPEHAIEEPRGVREWLRSVPAHPALVMIAIGCLALIFFVFLIERPTPAPAGSISAWGGATPAGENPTAYGASAPLSATANATDTSLSPMYIPPNGSGAAGGAASETDITQLLAEISQPTRIGVVATSSAAASSTAIAYTFIPTGLISTSSPASGRSALQTSLYEYGNDAGGYIQTYENSHRALTQTITNQLADRYDPNKAQAVKDIGDALIAVGKSLERLDQVPAVAQSANLALAKSYEEIGADLKLIPDAKTDQALLDAVKTYDAAADTFARHYIAVANLFVGAKVTFSSYDSGSVFMFSGSQGL